VSGEKIIVVEDKTGDDITRLILLQVIAEQEHGGQPILSTQLLESLIRCYGNAMEQSISRCLEQSVLHFEHEHEAPESERLEDVTPARQA
jgi:polyhydroxyalkanoate synthesis repressor PhaR